MIRASMRRWRAVLLVTVAAGAVLLAVATWSDLRPAPEALLPEPDAAARPQYFDKRYLPLNAHYDTDWNLHAQAALHEIPPFLRQAFIHAEDKRFYSHHGPDWRARLAALALNLRHGEPIRGASTISEQVVRMLRPRPRTVWSRWLEGFEASRLERAFSKDQILEFYLNQVPYASRRRGVRQAANFYFARDLETLSDREMLTLAVLVRSPSRLDLRRDPEASAAAILRLADAMLARGAISQARRDTIVAEPVELHSPALPVSAPHFLRFASAVAAGAGSGHSVVTTLDAELQHRLQGMLDSRVARLEPQAVEHGALLVADNATGDVLAWVVAGGGGPSGPRSHIDAVTTRRQPGSALKPFLYALALDSGRTLADVIDDEPLAENIGDGLHRYRNYSERFYGPVTLRDALGNSLNIPALKTLHAIGAEAYLEQLHALGFEGLREHPDVYGDGLALGNGGVSLFELVGAYVALANQGRARPLRVLADMVAAEPEAVVFSAEAASLIGNVLSDPAARAAEFGRDSVLNFPVQTAVKTGTSSDYRDAWAVGFDARFTVGIWMGNLDQTPMRGITGSIGPALLLRGVFAELNRNRATAPLMLSPRLTRREVCVPSPASPEGRCILRQEWFDPRHDAADNANGNMPDRNASTIAPRFRQPTDGLELAIDPRLPGALQAFEFVLDNLEPGDEVRWSIDGVIQEKQTQTLLWPVRRGTHRVAAAIRRDGRIIADLASVEFSVR